MINNIREFVKAPQLGDNYLDYLCDYKLGNVTHTIWLSVSGLAKDAYIWNKENIVTFYSNVSKDICRFDSNVNGALASNLSYEGPLVKILPGIKDQIFEQKQYYHSYPRIVFLAEAVSDWDSKKDK